jgi:hypothetical protein
VPPDRPAVAVSNDAALVAWLASRSEAAVGTDYGTSRSLADDDQPGLPTFDSLNAATVDAAMGELVTNF